ncbi:MAG: YCF48-related protein [Halieaceae bacterium]|nr:YCF48-related protein [Halieaceae bacterium]
MRWIFLSLLTWAGGVVAADYALQPALPVTDPARTQLLDITAAGERLLALGERGVIVYSDDGGQHWEQARVPVSETLTALSFPTEDHGWAVGHGGVILHSGDGGLTWQQQFDGNDANRQRLEYVTDRYMMLEQALEAAEAEPDEELLYALEEAQFAVEDAELALETGPADPFLDVWFADAQHGWAVGAYGMIYRTGNGGLQWRIAADSIENLEGYHYYAMDAADGGTLYLSGEAGLLYRSDNGGERWQRLGLDYDGSLFGVIALDAERVVTFGLRGNIFFSADRGETWEDVTAEDGRGLSYYGGRRIRNGHLVLVGAGGVMATSPDGREYQLEVHSGRQTFSSVLSEGSDLLLAGMGGVVRIPKAQGRGR